MCRVLRLRYSVVAGCAFVLASAGLAASGGVPSVDPNDRIVYNLSRSDGASWLAVSNLDGTSLTTLMPPLRKRGSIEPSALAWSPRGQQLAFVAESDRGVLYALDVRRKRVRPLVDLRHRQLGAGDTPFVWSPDGTRIAFAWSRGPACTRRRADVGVSIVDVRSRRIRELNALAPIQDAALRKHLFDVDVFAWSKDGRALLYGIHQYGRDCRDERDEDGPMRLVLVTGARWRVLGRAWYVDAVRWSPNSKQIAFAARCFDICDLYILNLAGGIRRLTHRNNEQTPGGGDTPRFEWSSSTGEIFYSDNSRLRAIDPAHRTHRKLNVVSTSVLTMSHDGKRLLVEDVSDPDNPRLYLTDAMTADSRVLPYPQSQPKGELEGFVPYLR